MPQISLADCKVREIFPGFHARVVHSARMSFSWVDIDVGAVFAEHQHPHEQVVNVLEGELELIVEGSTYRLVPGQVFVIPPNAKHHGRAITRCRVLDVFAPVREEYR
jgi:quercetin dioxygenase-like cupin family protein